MKPKTGFELILNYSSQCHKEKLQTESSAGANAASRANTIFSANDPLSEIVWTPDKGFSLKCVDSSFTNKNTSLLRDVEPSSMVLALLQSVTCATDKPVEDVLVQPLAVICAKSDVSSTDTQSSQDEEKSLALAHENPDRHLRWPYKGQSPELKNSFKSNFQSTYCQCFENVGTRMSHQVGESSSNSLCRWCSSLHPQVRPIKFFSIATNTISHLNECKVEETKEQYADNQLVIETKKLQNCFINKEASSSIGLKDEKGNNEDISKHKFNNVTPFSRLRDSEAMVSMFAKRLGAIKQCQQTE